MRATLYLNEVEITQLVIAGLRRSGMVLTGDFFHLDCGVYDALDHGRAVCGIATVMAPSSKSGIEEQTLDQATITRALEAGLVEAGFSMREYPTRFYFDPETGLSAHVSVHITPSAIAPPPMPCGHREEI